ncbi:hypothetical protein F5Y15DRAFT_179123 [Xylariaceae sp. FL0016]|nr:hypothetical protein F5Y15DRAFT_179123 [Xylariaceae sp. FL0016]
MVGWEPSTELETGGSKTQKKAQRPSDRDTPSPSPVRLADPILGSSPELQTHVSIPRPQGPVSWNADSNRNQDVRKAACLSQLCPLGRPRRGTQDSSGGQNTGCLDSTYLVPTHLESPSRRLHIDGTLLGCKVDSTVVGSNFSRLPRPQVGCFNVEPTLMAATLPKYPAIKLGAGDTCDKTKVQVTRRGRQQDPDRLQMTNKIIPGLGFQDGYCNQPTNRPT